MIKKYFSLVFVTLLICQFNLQINVAQTIPDNPAERNRIEQLKTDVYRFGVGKDARVVVKLKDGSKIKGYISGTIDDSFDLTHSKTKQITAIPYRDVTEIKKTGISKGKKILIGIGIAAAITVVVIGAAAKNSLDGFCPLGCKSY
jgi:hypothetical protein